MYTIFLRSTENIFATQIWVANPSLRNFVLARHGGKNCFSSKWEFMF